MIEYAPTFTANKRSLSNGRNMLPHTEILRGGRDLQMESEFKQRLNQTIEYHQPSFDMKKHSFAPNVIH